MSLDKYCNACEAFPTAGYCRLAGCPNKPPAEPPMDFDVCLERLVQWALGACDDCEKESDAKAIASAIQRDAEFIRSEADWATAMGDVYASGGLPERGCYVPRPDLALGACQVAAQTDQLDVAQCFAQTAIDFLTGNYEPLEEGA